MPVPKFTFCGRCGLYAQPSEQDAERCGHCFAPRPDDDATPVIADGVYEDEDEPNSEAV